MLESRSITLTSENGEGIESVGGHRALAEVLLEGHLQICWDQALVALLHDQKDQHRQFLEHEVEGPAAMERWRCTDGTVEHSGNNSTSISSSSVSHLVGCYK